MGAHGVDTKNTIEAVRSDSEACANALSLQRAFGLRQKKSYPTPSFGRQGKRPNRHTWDEGGQPLRAIENN